MKIRYWMKEHIRNNLWQYLLITGVFVLGLIIGEINANNLAGGTRSHLQQMINGFLEGGMVAYHEGNRIFLPAFLNQARTVIAVWFLGLTVIGVPIILAIVFVRGFSLGFTFGFLIKEKAWLGFAIALLSVLPQNIVYVPLAIACAVIGINFSFYIVRGRFTSEVPLAQGILTYTGIMVLLLLVLLVGALIEAFLSPWLLETIIK